MKPEVLLAGLLAVAVWGASPIASKFALAELPALDVAMLRTALGGLIALPMALALRLPLPAGATAWSLLATAAATGLVLFPLVFTFGIERTSATHGALILALLPLFTGAYAALMERRRPAARWWLGCAVAVIGEAILIGSHQPAMAASVSPTLAGDLLVLASTMIASAGYVAGGRLAQSGYPSPATTFWGAALSALLLLPILLAIGAPSRLATASPAGLGAIAYLAVGVTIVGYAAWYWALARGGIGRIGTLQFLQPITGVGFAVLLLGEPLTVAAVLATAVILAGVMIATRS